MGDLEMDGGGDEVVYPVAIFISDFFVLVTLITYLLMSEYRTNMFGKITIGFLINVFFSYFLIGVHYSLDIEVLIMSRDLLLMEFLSAQQGLLSEVWCLCDSGLPHSPHSHSCLLLDVSHEHPRDPHYAQLLQ